MHFINDCAHSNTLDDYANGCSVCTNCGLVIHDQLFQCYNTINNYVSNKEDYTYYSKSQFEQLMLEIYEKYSLPMCIYSNIMSTFKKQHNLANNILTFACQTYKTLLNTVPRSKREICAMFKISLQDFNNMERDLFKHESNIDTLQPSAILPRLSILQLKFSDMVKLGVIADTLYKKVSTSPNVVMAYVLITEGNKLSYFKHLPRKMLSINYASALCQVSSTSIRRLIKKMKK